MIELGLCSRQHCFQGIEWNANDPVLVSYNEISRLHDHAVDRDGYVDFTWTILIRAAMRNTCCKHRKRISSYPSDISYRAVDHPTPKPPALRLDYHSLAYDGISEFTAGIDDDDIAGLRH